MTGGLFTLIKDRLPGGASRLAALLLPQILPVSSVARLRSLVFPANFGAPKPWRRRVAPCDSVAALRNPVLVQREQATRRLALVVGLLLIPTVAVRTQNASFSSRTEAVRVDVLVIDKGQPLLGLVPSDFEVRDNGVLQQVDLVNFDEIPLNVTLALDMSDSVAGEGLGRLRAAAGGLLAALKPKDQAALITLSHIVQLGAGLTTDLESVRAALGKAQAVGETALVDGIYAGIMVGESDVGRSLLIVFSDGVDTSSWLSPNGVLDIAKRSDVVAYAVSTRSPLKPAFLRDLTSFTGGQLFEVEKTANLEAIFLRVLEEFRQRYLLSYTPRGVAPDGWHRLAVRVKRNATVKARPGYLAGS